MRRFIWVVILMALFWVQGCDDNDAVERFDTADLGPGITAAQVQSMDLLGPRLMKDGVNFSVYSKHATRIELLLFDDPENSMPTVRLPMKRFGDVWNLFVKGVGIGQHYGFVAWGPNWTYDEAWVPGSDKGKVTDCDADGNRFNPNKLLTDPYSLRLHRDFDWFKGSPASGTKSLVPSWGAASKSVVVKSQYEWSANEKQWRENRENNRGYDWNELITYEVHPKGFTANAGSAVAFPGTYKGIAEKASYLKDLGITAVELMPVMEKPDDGTYWGYNTLNFFVPEQRFSASPELSYGPMDEFKAMVDALHQQGIEVILDVVYNHTGEGGFWRSRTQLDSEHPFVLGYQSDPTAVTSYSFRGLDNQEYYVLNPGNKCQYMDDTGVGNQTRANNLPMRRMIVDSLRFWVEQMHVDGFRFDLATVLGMRDDNYKEWDNETSVLNDIVDDPVMKRYNVRLIAEPWHLAAYRIGEFPGAKDESGYRWMSWNGTFRDIWRRFIKNDDSPLSSGIGQTLTGSSEKYQSNSNGKPFHSVNFITAHDGFTLYDLTSYWQKKNGPSNLNPECRDNPGDAFCDDVSGEEHNESRNWLESGAGYVGSEDMKRQIMRNFFVAMIFSAGTPMILGGDEWMRTQWGNNNAYSTKADNEYNWFRWSEWQDDPAHQRMHDFVRNIIRIRKQYLPYFSPKEYADYTWLNAAGNGSPDWGSRNLMIHFPSQEGLPEVALLLNMQDHEVPFELPGGGAWKRIVDTQEYWDAGYFNNPPEGVRLNAYKSANVSLDDSEFTLTDGKYAAKQRSIVILKKL